MSKSNDQAHLRCPSTPVEAQDEVTENKTPETGGGAALDAASCSAKRSTLEISDKNDSNDSPLRSASERQNQRVDERAHKQCESNHKMGIEYPPDVPPYYLRFQYKLPYRSQSRPLTWDGHEVLQTWDCGSKGMRLILGKGKEQILKQGEFNSWIAGFIPPNDQGELRGNKPQPKTNKKTNDKSLAKKTQRCSPVSSTVLLGDCLIGQTPDPIKAIKLMAFMLK